ncbi:protein STICHEL-like 3 [Dorcoceras hygrometricum]|uniref:Protein STICHEL-like 3 n=1 Tax=Dorcoceras hygrometricum TaxID=472368 RepID=A0A2Z7CS55_9LAMI|nr:protein STICHEL-like 3 [Dorcoceras hygrometricum]
MTRAGRDRILKDVNGNISEHLRNHIHLTNCIHLKNHMHKNSPILADRALMRDLVVLQRSKSLRDPSASPPSWHSRSMFDAHQKRGEKDILANSRRSVGSVRPKDSGRISGNSPPVVTQPISKAVAGQVNRHNEGPHTPVSNRSIEDGICEQRRVKREESSRKSWENDGKFWHDDYPTHGDSLVPGGVSGKSELRDKGVKKKLGHRQDRHLETLSDQFKNIKDEFDDAASARNIDNVRQNQVRKITEEAVASIRSHGNSLNRAKRRRFRGARRHRPYLAAREVETQNEMSVASNSFAYGRAPQKYYGKERAQELDDQNVSGIHRNGCGIPWNWSSIHHRGKSFLDMAGRSLSCGLSDTRLKKGGSISQGRDIPDMPVMSEHSSSCAKSEGEALPLLLDASGSQGSIDHAAWHHDYSGELGIFADNLLKQDFDSDLASEGRSHERHKYRRQHNDMHQNLTQKYMPRTFKDLVGQNLVVQALSNAIAKRKVGLLYVFYGPHGTGKTSCAHIFARALNCQSLEHSKPFGFCNSCSVHTTGKNQNIREIGPVSNIDFQGIIEVLDNMVASQHESQYRVVIFDECDTLSSDCWSAILKVIDRSPRRVVFILVCSSLDVLPHIIISRCQKFFFPKLKDADIIYTLQWIATKEEIEIDKDALKLIASRSDGSLRDAEMTLEQLSLLGQRISLCLVQELVGLISDDKLVDLLDLALSADTVNTVKNLREIMESGVEPLALMSQLATVITDILAGNYDFHKRRPKRNNQRRHGEIASSPEKHYLKLKNMLRVSNDKMTWLTASLLQLAPDQQYMIPSSSTNTSINHSPLLSNADYLKERPRRSNAELPAVLSGSSVDVFQNDKGVSADMRGRVENRMVSEQVQATSNDKNKINKVHVQGKFHRELEEIWLDVLEKIPINSIKEFLYQEGKLISLSYGAAPTVKLLFNSQLTKSKAEKFGSYILQAFESVLRSPVNIEIRYDARKDTGAVPIFLQSSQASSSHIDPILLTDNGINSAKYSDTRRLKDRDASSARLGGSEIVEIEASPGKYIGIEHSEEKADLDRQKSESALAGATSQKTSTNTSFPGQRNLGDQSQSLSLVRSRLSLAHVIQHTDTQQNGWSKRKAVSIAEKLEQENLRLEPRSRRLLCWSPPTVSRRKVNLETKEVNVFEFRNCNYFDK